MSKRRRQNREWGYDPRAYNTLGKIIEFAMRAFIGALAGLIGLLPVLARFVVVCARSLAALIRFVGRSSRSILLTATVALSKRASSRREARGAATDGEPRQH